MLDRRVADFAKTVWDAASRVGNNAPRVADDIMASLFPRTCDEAQMEGASKMLRDGVVMAVARVLRGAVDPTGQGDFNDIDPRFAPLVEKLKSRSYYVEQAGEYVAINRLIAEPDLLDDARKFMRRKGLECLDEARRLDALYREVSAA